MDLPQPEVYTSGIHIFVSICVCVIYKNNYPYLFPPNLVLLSVQKFAIFIFILSHFIPLCYCKAVSKNQLSPAVQRWFPGGKSRCSKMVSWRESPAVQRWFPGGKVPAVQKSFPGGKVLLFKRGHYSRINLSTKFFNFTFLYLI